MEAVERDHPELADEVDREIARYFDEDHPPAPAPDGFLEELRAALPVKHAVTVERIYRRHHPPYSAA